MNNYFQFLNDKTIENLKSKNAGQGRLPWPQFNAFRPFVISELNRRKNEFPTAMVSPFVRLTSTKKDTTNNYQFFTLGLHGFDKSDINLFDEIQGGNRTDVVGYAYELSNRDENGKARRKLIYSNQLASAEQKIFDDALERLGQGTVPENDVRAIIGRDVQDNIATINTIYAKGTHPVPGITSVSVARKGIGTPLVASVSWKCYNRAQLEFLRNHFLVVGGYVVLEWGNRFSNKPLNVLFDFSDDNAVPKLKDIIKKGREMILREYVAPNAGNYDLLAGVVANFKIDIEPNTGAYICSTVIVTTGEEMWGLNTHKTRVNNDSNINLSQPTSIYEYFYQGGKFDQLIEKYRTDKKLVADYKHTVQIQSEDTVTGMQHSSIAPENTSFVSWEFFSRVLIQDLMAILKDPTVKNTLNQFLDFSGLDFVGNSTHLMSTDPETMILVKKEFEQNIPEGFKGASYFDFGDPTNSNLPANQERGRLIQGVWLNTNMIRQAFSLSSNFENGVSTILMNMNNATANYWKLQLYFEDEINQYKIADGNYVDIARLTDTNKESGQLALYKFNKSKKGDLLRLSFDSAFPKELVSQMMLSARFLASSPEEQARLIKEYPLLGTTSLYVFALNWTSLEDVLKTALDSDSVEVAEQTDPQFNPQSTNATATTETAIRVSNRIAETQNVGPMTGYSTVQNPKTNPSNGPITSAGELFGNKLPPLKVVIGKGAAVRNNNPGNLVFSNQPGATRDTEGARRFARFKTPIEGYMALLRDIEIKKSGKSRVIKPTATIREYVTVYAPPSENNTEEYIRQVVTDARIQTGRSDITERTPFAEIDTNILGKFIAKKESSTLVTGDVDGPTIKNFSFQDLSKGPGPAFTGNGRNSAKPTTPVKTIANEREGDYIKKFGHPIRNMIELNPSDMVARITQNGLRNAGLASNSFVAPFPTTTSIELEILGLSGISVSDGFYVDKLPFLFEKHGCFQVVEVSEAINPNGWSTKIRGYFKLLWIDGSGPKPTPI